MVSLTKKGNPNTVYTPKSPTRIAPNIFLFSGSEIIKAATKAEKIGKRYWITVASESGNLFMDSYTRNNATVPVIPLAASNFL